MRTEFDILLAYRRAKSTYTKIGFRVPKNPEIALKKLKEADRWNLSNITRMFNEMWANIDPYEYFLCGFELYGKKFLFHCFLRSQVWDVYSEKQKSKQKKIQFVVKSFRESYKYVRQYLSNTNWNKTQVSLFTYYCNLYDEKEKDWTVISHFKDGKINKYFLTWLIAKKFFLLEKVKNSDIKKNFRIYLNDLAETKIIPL
jgi:hypothetical protein